MLVLFCVAEYVAADNWPNWRGPNYNGVAPGKSFPTKWSSTENVLWKVPLPGRGGSTPVVWGEQIFLTYGADGKNVAVCLDREGKQQWQVAFGEERPGKNRKGTGSNPSPITDGQHVFVYFKSGDLACLDLAGKVVWQTNLQKSFGEDTLWWDLGTSPVLTENAVVVACIQTGPSYLIAFDKRTGKQLWKQDRILSAPVESAQAYTTPIPAEENGRQTLIVLGADHVTSHDAATGQELWRVGGLNPEGERNFRSIASPVVSDGIVVAPYARGRTLTAIRLGGSGDVTSSHVLWTREGVAVDVPTPVAIAGRVYLCTDRGDVSCLDIQTGKTIWTGQLERNRTDYSSSPILADGKLYITREDGKTFVLEQGDSFKVLAANELGEMTVSTPVCLDGKILIRTFESLYCIGR
ncbi:MAG: PQQ-binding-like beta-propeller repeat protein [Planctomycetes bacterium]|nr:PQQ-binding-like beta-propeller repeat protein [Planctomycetota bacterium]